MLSLSSAPMKKDLNISIRQDITSKYETIITNLSNTNTLIQTHRKHLSTLTQEPTEAA